MGDATEIHIVGGVLHEHLTGIGGEVYIIRNNTKLKPILHDEYYDFNFQDYKQSKNEVTLKKVSRSPVKGLTSKLNTQTDDKPTCVCNRKCDVTRIRPYMANLS